MEILISVLLGLFVILSGTFYILFLNKEFKKYDNCKNNETKTEDEV